MKTNHRKVKSYVALLTAVACMATGTASLSASAVNSAVTGTNISQKQTQKLSETVYTFSDTEINLVLPNTAFASGLLICSSCGGTLAYSAPRASAFLSSRLETSRSTRR